MASVSTKEPTAVKDYKFDFDDELDVGETIDSKTVTATAGLTVDSSSITDSGRSVTYWLSGGQLGGETMHVLCTAVTSSSRTYTKRHKIKIAYEVV